MNKSQLVDVITEKLKLPRKKVDEAVDFVFGLLVDEMAKGGRVEIRGLGSFVVRNYGAYKGRNPRTGETIDVAPKRLPHFKVGKELKFRVDGKRVPASQPRPDDVTEEF